MMKNKSEQPERIEREQDNYKQGKYILGRYNTEILPGTAAEYKDAVISMANQARHSIDIYTQDLEAEIYNNEDVAQAVINLAKKHPSTRIRILVQDTRTAVQNGHRLIRLAQQLTSSVFIHRPSNEHKNENNAFMVVDKMGLILRPLAAERNYTVKVNFKCPRLASTQSVYFDKIWQHSTPDAQTRRIYV